MVKTQINELLTKEMTRKEFLQHIGSGILILFGISGLIKALIQNQPQTHPRALERNPGAGYGSSAYGR